MRDTLRPTQRHPRPYLRNNQLSRGSMNGSVSETSQSDQQSIPKSYANAAVEAPTRLSSDLKQANPATTFDPASTNSAPQKTTPRTKANGTKPKRDGDKLVFEKYTDGHGTHLTSVRAGDDHEEELKRHKEVAPRRSKATDKKEDSMKQPALATGRRAGAGWEKSA